VKRTDRIRRTLASAAVLILAGTAARAQVQLDDRCTINVLNRTAQVRARATCHGITRKFLIASAPIIAPCDGSRVYSPPDSWLE